MDKNFNETYSLYAKELFRFCKFKTNNREASQDIVSESFLKLFQNQDKVENERAWLYKVCRNLIIDKFYSNKQNLVNLDDEEFSEIEDLNLDLNNIVINSIELKMLKNALSNLDPYLSEVIILKVWEDLSFVEIAEILEITSNAVKKRFYRGINKLKILLN